MRLALVAASASLGSSLEGPSAKLEYEGTLQIQVKAGERSSSDANKRIKESIDGEGDRPFISP